MKATHLSEDSVARFVQGSLGAEERARVEQHLETCAVCLRLVGLAARLGDAANIESARYAVERRLGSGAMGTVFLAHDRALNRKVAIKRVKGVATAERRERLRAEAQTMAQLSHPNVASVFDVGEDEQGLFVAMQWVDGGTARDWLSQTPRSWREIVKMFIEAGNGLAAAHAANIVHRDFKPSNVLVASNGEVRVTDFGLASFSLSPSVTPALVEPLNAYGTWLTQSGALIGTPAYMAPEQHRGEAASVQSDQFSFCVALTEALTGQRPFSGQTLKALRESIDSGPRFAGAFSKLPSPLQRALRRGMAADPLQRFASMSELVQTLRQTLALQPLRTRVATQVGLALLLVAIGVVGTRLWSRRCVPETEALRHVWNDASRTAVQQAFARTQRPFVAQSFSAVDDAFKRFINSWKAERESACIATRERNEYSEAMMDRRYACLDQRVVDAESFVRLLRDADEAVVLRAAVAASTVLRLDACEDVPQLAAVTPRAASAWEQQLASVKALVLLEKRKEALEGVRKIVAGARAAGDKITLAEALRLEGRLNPDSDAGVKTLEEAVATAKDVNADDLRAAALLEIAWVKTHQGKRSEAEAALRQALALFERIPQSFELKMRRLSVQAADALVNGQFATGVDFTQQQLTLVESVRQPSPEKVAAALVNLASALARAGRFDESQAAFLRGLKIFEQQLGPSHPHVASTLMYLGELELHLGLLDDSVQHSERALAIYEAACEPTDSRLAFPLTTLGTVKAVQARPIEEVQPYFERSRRQLEVSFGKTHPQIAVNLMLWGGYLGAMGQLPQARAAFDEACALREAHQAWAGDCEAQYGVMLAQTGDSQAALTQLEKAKQKTGVEGNAAFTSGDEALMEWARLKSAMKDAGEAFQVGEQAYARLKARGDATGLDQTRFSLAYAALLASRGSKADAQRAAEQSLTMLESHGFVLDAKRARALLERLKQR